MKGRADDAQAFAVIARALQSEGTAQQILQRIVDLGPELIEGCEQAGITTVVAGRMTTPATSGPGPVAVDRIQYETNQGPCLDALRKHAVFVTDDLTTETRWPLFASRAAKETGVRSMLSFRLFVDQDTFGSLNLYATTPAAFGPLAIAAGGVFASHAAVAFASALDRDRSEHLAEELATSERLSEGLQEQVAAAVVLQRSMLTSLPNVPGLELAARYVPAVAERQIGGDWYDAFFVPSGGTGLAIGDVAGHDLEAAVRMAQLRNILRTLACDRDETASEILDRLDRTIIRLDVTDTATCIYGILRAAEPPEGGPNPLGGLWSFSFANAGHPPPLHIVGKQATYLETEDHLLLGLGQDIVRTQGTIELSPGSTLLLYTDGLVEHRDSDLTEGMERLQELALELADLPLGALCDQLIATLAAGRNDDVCVLAIRTPSGQQGK